MNNNTKSGVYKIVCSENGKVYIGSSKNIDKRWKEHKWLLKNNRHGNKKLQAAFDLYGMDSFTHEIVEIVLEESRLNEVELFHIKSYNALDRKIGFNLSEITRGVSLSGDKHPLFGKTWKEESKRKLSSTIRGSNHPRFGMVTSEEAKEKMRVTLGDKLKGNNHPRALKVVQLSLDGEFIKVFGTGREAAAFHNREPSSLTKTLKGKQKTYAGYKWMYLDEYEKAKVTQ